MNICHYSNDNHACQQQVLASSSTSTTQNHAVLPAINGETYSTAFIDCSQLPQQQQLVAFLQQACSISRWIIGCLGHPPTWHVAFLLELSAALATHPPGM